MSTIKKSVILLIATGAFFGLASCGIIPGLGNTGGTGSTVEGLGNVLLSFPAALLDQSATASSRSVTVKTTSTDVTDYLDYLYRPVRNTYTPLANRAIEFVDSVLESVEGKIFANKTIMAALDSAGSWSSYNDTRTEAYRVTLTDSTYTVEIWKQVDTNWLKTLDLNLVQNGSDYRGTAIAVSDTAGLTERPVYQVTFDTADASLGKYVEVRVANIQPAETGDSNVPRKLWLKAWQSGDNFYVVANIHYVQVDIETGSPYYDQFIAELGGPSTDLQASYIYQGAVDTTTGRGSVSLALVPASETDNTTIFDVYSIGEIYKRAIAAWIRTDPYLDPPTNSQLLIDALNSILTTAGHGDLAIDTTSSENEIFTALEAVKDYLDTTGGSSADLDAVLFVVKVVNPGYYDGTAGFVGTDALNTPEWAADVPGFAGQVSISAAEIAGADFTVTMPAPAQPDF